MSGFDDLERQLLGTIRARAESPARRRLFPRRRRALMLGLLAFAITGSGGAAVATSLHGKSARELGLSIGQQATTETGRAAVCLPDTSAVRRRSVMTDRPMLPVIPQRIPALATPPTPADLRRATTMLGHDSLGGGEILRSSIHFFHVDRRTDVLVYVTARDAMFAAAHPEACRMLRRQRAARLARGRSADVLSAASTLIDHARDTQIGAQLLLIGAVPRHAARTWGAAGMLVEHDAHEGRQALPYGVVLSGGGTYTGFAHPEATKLLVRADHPDLAPGLPRSIPAVDGFFVLHLTGSTGRIHLTEVDAAGTVLGRYHVR